MRSDPTSPNARSTLSGAALVFVGAVGYGVLATVIRLAYGLGFGPGQVVGAQMTFGCLALWALALARRSVKPLERRVAFTLVLAGIPTGLTGAFYYGAVHALASASLAIVLLFQFTWMGLLVECALDRRRPRVGEIASLVCLVVGTVLATGVVDGELGTLDPIGVALGLASAASYTAVIYASGRVAPALDPWHRSAWLATGAMVTVLLLHPPGFLVDGSLGRGLFTVSLATAALGVVVPTVCFAIGVPRTGPALASIVGAVELPAAIVAASLVLDEPTSMRRWVGVGVILVGIAVARVA